MVVGCEIDNPKATSGFVDDTADSLGKKTIHLHLKKFFRGARFTSIPFLRSLEEKHQLGDLVCVSGKVSFWFSMCWLFVCPSMLFYWFQIQMIHNSFLLKVT